MPLRPDRVSTPSSLSDGSSWHVDYRPFDYDLPPWSRPVAEKAVDFYSEEQADVRAVRAILNTLMSPTWSDAPEPFVGATEGQGLSVEFDDAGLHVNIEADRVGRLSVYVLRGSEFEWEGDLDQVPSGIEKWAWQLGTSKRDQDAIRDSA
jgi:hypothetical protein